METGRAIWAIVILAFYIGAWVFRFVAPRYHEEKDVLDAALLMMTFTCHFAAVFIIFYLVSFFRS